MFIDKGSERVVSQLIKVFHSEYNEHKIVIAN